MSEHWLALECPAAVQRHLASICGPATGGDTRVSDMRARPWCSIDNDDLREVNPLTACEWLANGSVRVFVADVDARVENGSPINEHARFNTTSDYTAARILPMLPVRLPTDVTSLKPGQDRLAIHRPVGEGAQLGDVLLREGADRGP